MEQDGNVILELRAIRHTMMDIESAMIHDRLDRAIEDMAMAVAILAEQIEKLTQLEIDRSR